MDEADPKLKEFLEVMQPASKNKTWASPADQMDLEEPPAKIQAIEVPDAESDEEYETVPKRQRKDSPPKISAAILPTDTTPDATEQSISSEQALPSVAPNATDDDWLRSRTNRLLDLVDPDTMQEVQFANKEEAQSVFTTEPAAPVSVEPASSSKEVKLPEEDSTPVGEPSDKPDPVLEEISKNGRLFVRNLPYTATEEDLRRHFEPFGPLEEVSPWLCFFNYLPSTT